MSTDNKWSSYDKQQLINKNFKKFMEEGDFSPDPPEPKIISGRKEKESRGINETK